LNHDHSARSLAAFLGLVVRGLVDLVQLLHVADLFGDDGPTATRL